jgi:GNAT superfamily N-acetyltransferase
MKNYSVDCLFTPTLTSKQALAVHLLWNKEYPFHLAHQHIDDFYTYLNELQAARHLLWIGMNGTLGAWYCDFVRNNESWFAMIVDSAHQGKGIGSALLNQAKLDRTVLNGWVIDHENERKHNGDPYLSPLSFYLKNKFTLLPEIRLELDLLSAVQVRWEK